MKLHSKMVGTGPTTVVFLPGLLGQGKNWSTVAGAISDVATSYLVDLPNHGKSDWSAQVDFAAWADSVAHWLRDQRLAKPVVVGHSLGGKVAMQLALRHPELVAGLVVVDIAPARNERADEFSTILAALSRLDLSQVDSRAAASEALQPEIPDERVRGFVLQNLQRTADGWGWQVNLEMLAAATADISGWPATSSEYGGPTLWVLGAESGYVTPEFYPAMRTLFPNVERVAVPNAGHWVHADAPEQFTQILRRFMTSATSSTATD